MPADVRRYPPRGLLLSPIRSLHWKAPDRSASSHLPTVETPSLDAVVPSNLDAALPQAVAVECSTADHTAPILPAVVDSVPSFPRSLLHTSPPAPNAGENPVVPRCPLLSVPSL